MTKANEATPAAAPATHIELTIRVPRVLHLTNDNGLAETLEWDKVPLPCVADILCGGANVVMQNTYNSGGKAATPKERLAKLKARRDSWYAGSYRMSGGGPRESLMGEAREAYVAGQMSPKLADDGTVLRPAKTQKQVDAYIRDKVTEAFGKDESATFAKFLEAMATLASKVDGAPSYDELLERITADAMAAVERRRAETAKATEAVFIDEAALADMF